MRKNERGDCLRVAEIMSKNFPFIREDELVTKARAMLRSHRTRILPVVNYDKRLLGIIYRRNIMAITSSVSAIRVKGLMENPRLVAVLDEDGYSVAKRMVKLDEWYAPVVETKENKLYKGVLGLENFIAHFLKIGSSKLSETLESIMSSEIVTCSPDDEVDNVWRLMQRRAFAGLPVVKKDKLVGMVTQKDFLDSGAVMPTFESKKGRYKSPPKISAIMKTSVISLKPSATIRKAAEIMLNKNIGRLPITDEKNRLVGIVDREDIVRAFLYV